MGGLNNSQISFINSHREKFENLPEVPFLFEDLDVEDRREFLSFIRKADERGIFKRHKQVDGKVVREVPECVWDCI
jgi:hypothetical protein